MGSYKMRKRESAKVNMCKNAKVG